MPGRGWGPSKLLVTLLLPIALMGGAAASLARPVADRAEAAPTARLVATSSGVPAIMSRAAEVESRTPRRGGSPVVGVALFAMAGLASVRRRSSLVDPRWGCTSGGTGRAHGRAPPLTI